MMGHWQALDHTADLALHIWGNDLADLFITAGQGLMSLITEPQRLTLAETRALELTAPDVETLLVDWLNELLYLSECHHFGFVGATFTHFDETGLQAQLHGGPWPGYTSYVKAATFHNLAIRRTPTGYETEIVFDT